MFALRTIISQVMRLPCSTSHTNLTPVLDADDYYPDSIPTIAPPSLGYFDDVILLLSLFEWPKLHRLTL